MFINPKLLSGRQAALAAVLASGSLVLLGTPSMAQPVLTAGKLAPNAARTPMTTISGHVPELTRVSDMVGVLPANQVLLFSITLPMKNQAALADLLKGLNNPSDSRYGQYLSPVQFAAQFGPTQTEYNSLLVYLQSKGLTVTSTFPSRTYVSLSGTVGQINSALGVTLKQFQSPEGRVFHAPDTEVKVPAGIAKYILSVTGLDDANPPRPQLHMLRRVAAPAKSMKIISPSFASPDATAVQNPGEQGTGPGGGYGPSDLKTAYNLNGTGLDGSGQTLAMVEFGTKFNIKDILKYEAVFGLPRPLITTVPVDGGPTAYTGAATETNLDIDMQIALAPKAKQILVFLQGNAGSVVDALNAVYTDGRAKQLSVSYGFGTESATSTTPSAGQNALNTAYTQLAAGGVSVYVSSGDSGTTSRSTGTTVSADINATQPMICSVGGTALTVQTAGSNEAYGAESVWNYNGTASGGAGGGGTSKQWTIAGSAMYQANAATFASLVPGSNVSTTNRNFPDISLVGSPETGVALYSSVDPTLSGPGWYIFGGTSASAPLWAGFNALVNQKRAAAGLATLGFPNNSLYSLAYNANGLTSAYTSLFHDINDGYSNSTIPGGTNFADVTGFDDSTGLGTFQGANLITALSQY